MKVIQTIVTLLSLMLFTTINAQEKINIAISATPNSLVPFYSTDANSQNINRLVHSALVDFNEKMQVVCNACETFTEKMIGEKQIVTFKLKSGMTFTDGSLVTVEDVKKSFEYFARSEKVNSTFIGSYETLENVVIKDAQNVEFIYKHFSLENLSNLSLLKIVKLKDPRKNSYETQDILGCGPYTLQSIQPLEIIIAPRDQARPTLIFKVVKDETTLALKLINKEIDLSVANMSPRKVFWLKAQEGIKVWEIPGGNYQFMGLNQKREIFNDVRVRRAFSLLIPRKEILEYKLKNTAVLSVGMFSPAFSDLYDPVEVEKNDIEEARKLLAEAGWKKNKNGILERNGKRLVIDWKVSNNKASIEVVEVLQHFFQKEGMIINVSIQEWGTYMSAFKSGKFDIVVGQWVGFTGPDMLKFVFHSTNTPPKGGNRVGYNNPEVDSLLDKATVETNAEKRTMLYKQASKMINKDYAAINLWHPNIIWIGRSCLSDINLDASGSFYPLITLEKNCGK
jgi:peptide/nickel transport system substrate-binding protein